MRTLRVEACAGIKVGSLFFLLFSKVHISHNTHTQNTKSKDWVIFTYEARQEYAEIRNEHVFFSSAERTTLINFLVQEVTREAGTFTGFPTNNPELHKQLSRAWVFSSFFSFQPLNLIRNYYGEEIAFYFAFLEHYTLSLLFLAGAGLVTYVHQYYYGPETLFSLAFVFFLLVWDTLFFESWKRKEHVLAFQWHCQEHEQHANAKIVMTYKHKIPWVIGYSLSFVLLSMLLLCKILVFALVLPLDEAFFSTQLPCDGSSSWMCALVAKQLPTACLALAIQLTSLLNRKAAVWTSTALEQRETVEEARNVIVFKLCLQHFINTHAVLFYVAFWIQDFEKLKHTLLGLLVVFQLFGQILEVGSPLIKSLWKRRTPQANSVCFKEEYLEEFSGVFDEYLELWIQYGQVTLYSSVFPLAALAALMNNVWEIKGDAFRLMMTSKRPVPPMFRAYSMGNWLPIFEFLGYVSVCTNMSLVLLALLKHDTFMTLVQNRFQGVSEFHILLAVIGVEHVLIASKVALSFFIPDVPSSLSRQIAQSQAKEDLLVKHMLEQRFRLQSILVNVDTVRNKIHVDKTEVPVSDVLVEYVLEQTKARFRAEEEWKRMEHEFKIKSAGSGLSTFYSLLVWLNLAVALFAALLILSGF